jgi:hypothetical protein
MSQAARSPQQLRGQAADAAGPVSQAKAIADHRPQAAAQRAMIDSVNASPAMAAQRQVLQGAFGPAAQLEPDPVAAAKAAAVEAAKSAPAEAAAMEHTDLISHYAPHPLPEGFDAITFEMAFKDAMTAKTATPTEAPATDAAAAAPAETAAPVAEAPAPTTATDTATAPAPTSAEPVAADPVVPAPVVPEPVTTETATATPTATTSPLEALT